MPSVLLARVHRLSMAITIATFLLFTALLTGPAHSMPRHAGSDSTTIETPIDQTAATAISNDIGEQERREVEVDHQVAVQKAAQLAISTTIGVAIDSKTATTISGEVVEQWQLSQRHRRNVEVDQASDEEAVPLAIEYMQSVIRDYSCYAPQPRVLTVQDMHPRADATYATGNVVLHRCSHDTGCCQLSEICTAKTKTTIKLPVLMLNHEKMVEFLSFVNHTECHCVSRKEFVND